MIKRLLRRILRRLGYDILKIPKRMTFPATAAPPSVQPIWPLPRGGFSDEEIRAEFDRHPLWHYAYKFEGGLSFSTAHNDPGLNTNDPERHLQRFMHFMPYVIQAQGGTLAGKRVLDIACNSGFWSIQCALMGAEVVGFDARPELIAEANVLRRITGAANVEFRVLDFWQMSPEIFGTFDVVLNLGFLYHVPKPLEALERTQMMSRKHILLDTAVHPSDDLTIHLKWEEPSDIRMAASEGMVALPTGASVELMLRHLKMKTWLAIPVRTNDLPVDYLTSRRTSWLIEA